MASRTGGNCCCKVQFRETDWNSPCSETQIFINAEGSSIDVSVDEDEGSNLGNQQFRKSTDDQWGPAYRNGTDIASNKLTRRAIVGPQAPCLSVSFSHQTNGFVPTPFSIYSRIFSDWELIPTGDWYNTPNNTSGGIITVPSGRYVSRQNCDAYYSSASHSEYGSQVAGFQTDDKASPVGSGTGTALFPNVVLAAEQSGKLFVYQFGENNFQSLSSTLISPEFSFESGDSIFSGFDGYNDWVAHGTSNVSSGPNVEDQYIIGFWNGRSRNCYVPSITQSALKFFRKVFETEEEALSFATTGNGNLNPYMGIANPEIALDLSDGADPIYFGVALYIAAGYHTYNYNALPASDSALILLDNLELTIATLGTH